MNIRYLAGAILSFPLLPLMYYQGIRIRASVPELPEAKGIEGYSEADEVIESTLNIICIGESTIAGVGVQTHEEGFAGTFATELSSLLNINVKWKVYARSGYTAKRVNEIIVPQIMESQVDLIVIGLGGNDAFTLNRPSRWRIEIRSLIESLKSKFPGTIIVFCNMPPIKEFPAFTSLMKFTLGNLVEILGGELQNIVGDFEDVYYFGDNITFQGWINKYQLNVTKEDFFSDGVHPSRLTYQIWAKDIANKLVTKDKIKSTLQHRV